MLKEAWMLAIETLSWMELQELSIRLALVRTIKQLEIKDPNAIHFAYRLVCETVKRQNLIDKFIADALEPSSMNEFDLGTQAFLRLYVYKTKIMENWNRIDIEGAQKIAGLARSILGSETLRGVEHVLGSLLTKKPDSILIGLNDEDKIGLLTFHPSWIVKYYFKIFGRREAIAMFEENLRTPQIYIRLNTLKADENEILERLTEDSIEVEKVEKLKYAYIIVSTKKPITRTDIFRDGWFYIQDKASCFAAEVADPKPGMTLLDVCAAPGAKTAYLAQLMRNEGVIYSIDYSKRRMTIWKKEVTRMGVDIAMPIIADACVPLPLKPELDVVVLDPPCTGTGVFRKFPSAKWRLTGHSLDKMVDIQWRMINNCSDKVAPGGILIYSTCSLTVEENERLIQKFLKWHPEFSLTEVNPRIGLPGLRGLKECRRLYPHVHQCNGFFIAKLHKRS